MLEYVLFGILFSSLISGLAYYRGSLSSSGAIAALVVGTIIYAFGSLFWFGLLLSFFISSSLWSNFRRNHKSKVEDLFAKTGRRDAVQVFANGGIGAVLTIIHFHHPSLIWMMTYVGVMATVNADTWGTEIGVLSKGDPIHVLRGKRVEKGTSGGISGLGMVGTAVGAFFISALATYFYWLETDHTDLRFIFNGTFAGIVGALMDSLLGATVQRMYFCSTCNQETEKPVHCQKQTKYIRGLRWCSNDVVNLISSIIGGAAAILFF